MIEGTEKRRIGIYGGTFSPPHNAHVRAALAFLAEARLDILYVVPTSVSPQKHTADRVDPILRLAMTQAAFETLDKRICVSDFEIQSEGVSYTYRTLAHFSEICEGELYFLCGEDMFLILDEWRCPERIFSLATVAYIMRTDDPIAYETAIAKERYYQQLYGAHTLRVAMEPMELSASCIRQMVRKGSDVSAWIPPAVCRIIEAHNLYRSDET